MAAITIVLPEERYQKLRVLAEEAKLTPEELLRVSVEEWLREPQDEFSRAANYVLEKNAELYRRLA